MLVAVLAPPQTPFWGYCGPERLLRSIVLPIGGDIAQRAPARWAIGVGACTPSSQVQSRHVWLGTMLACEGTAGGLTRMSGDGCWSRARSSSFLSYRPLLRLPFPHAPVPRLHGRPWPSSSFARVSGRGVSPAESVACFGQSRVVHLPRSTWCADMGRVRSVGSAYFWAMGCRRGSVGESSASRMGACGGAATLEAACSGIRGQIAAHTQNSSSCTLRLRGRARCAMHTRASPGA